MKIYKNPNSKLYHLTTEIQGLQVVNIKVMRVPWDYMTHSFTDRYQHFGGTSYVQDRNIRGRVTWKP